MIRIHSLVVGLALAGTCPAWVHAQVPAPGRDEALVGRVKESIRRGVAHVLEQQRGDGGWEATENRYEGGSTALIVLALVNCDGVIEDEALEQKRRQSVERGLAYLRKLEPTTVYVRSLQTMALAEAGKAGDLPLLRKNVQWLLDARVFRKDRFIGWEYDKRPNSTGTDASNSQYAMLGLWYGRQAGVAIPREVWAGIQEYYTRTQNADGSWIYSADYSPLEEKNQASVTMTIAGLCGLLIAGMELNGGREQWQPNGAFANCGNYAEDPAVARALKWIQDPKHFTIERDNRTYYHLYGLERAGRLSGLRFFGEHDWYREGSDALTRLQKPDGSWKTHGGWDRWPLVNSGFALLFLSKGRTPVVISKVVHGRWPQRDDHDWNNDRNDLRHLTEYVSKSQLFDRKAIAWQTYDISQAIQARLDKSPVAGAEDEAAVLADMLQAPILYLTGHQSPLRRLQGIENKLIKRYVENGGFIVAEACCGSPQFDAGIKEWVKEQFDGQELEPLQSTHPVWTCFHTVQPGQPYKLMGLRVGCRTVMIYSPQDLSCHWESNRTQDGPAQRAFELGSNLIAYATGRIPPQPRLTPIPVASDKDRDTPPQRGYFQVAQIQYRSDDWQPAPKAMSNLMRHVHKVTGLDVLLGERKINLRDSSESQVIIKSKFFYLHGREEISRMASKDLEPWRFTLENGGLLLADACCGNETFDKTFRLFLQDLFPAHKLERVPVAPVRDALFGTDLKDGEVLSKENIKCRIKANAPMVPMEPFLEGIRVNGRWVVLYSKYDIGCALERNTSMDCVGYDPASALRIATAVVRYHVQP